MFEQHGMLLNPLRVEFLMTVGKQQQKFKHFIISIVIQSKIDILAVS